MNKNTFTIIVCVSLFALGMIVGALIPRYQKPGNEIREISLTNPTNTVLPVEDVKPTPFPSANNDGIWCTEGITYCTRNEEGICVLGKSQFCLEFQDHTPVPNSAFYHQTEVSLCNENACE